jgi:hypothetical protein
MSANPLHRAIFSTLQSDVVVKAVLLELNSNLIEAHHKALGNRRAIWCLDVQPKVIVLAISNREIGRFELAFMGLD